jgi:hypothetical protein
MKKPLLLFWLLLVPTFLYIWAMQLEMEWLDFVIPVLILGLVLPAFDWLKAPFKRLHQWGFFLFLVLLVLATAYSVFLGSGYGWFFKVYLIVYAGTLAYLLLFAVFMVVYGLFQLFRKP